MTKIINIQISINTVGLFMHQKSGFGGHHVIFNATSNSLLQKFYSAE